MIIIIIITFIIIIIISTSVLLSCTYRSMFVPPPPHPLFLCSLDLCHTRPDARDRIICSRIRPSSSQHHCPMHKSNSQFQCIRPFGQPNCWTGGWEQDVLLSKDGAEKYWGFFVQEKKRSYSSMQCRCWMPWWRPWALRSRRTKMHACESSDCVTSCSTTLVIWVAKYDKINSWREY